ncbi:MAG: hypothetical protein GX638_12455 [Crenarchaeota archaeon]|nr:hypothetical protein [Thermoproteota archaeon]
MPILMFEEYVIKSDKLNEFGVFLKKYLVWLEKKRPILYKEVKSHKLLSQMFGGNFGKYIEIWEYDNLADCEKCLNRLMTDNELMTEIFPEYSSYFAPATHKMEIWNSET